MAGAFMYRCLYFCIRFMVRIGWWRWRIEGLEHLPPRHASGMVIATNHIHWLDIPVIGGLLPFPYRLSWLAKIEIFKHPLAAWWFRTMNVIPIRRGKRDLAALDLAVAALREGAVLLIFPEGHRSGDGVLLPGRGGAVRLAAAAGVPIVPVAINGTQHGLAGAFRREPVVVQIGRPYTVTGSSDGKIPPDQMEQMTADLMLRIAALLPPEQRGPYQLPVDTARQSSD